MVGETSATGARRNILRSALHPDMSVSDSQPTEDGHCADPQVQIPPPQAVPALSLDFFQTEEQIEEAIAILRERRRVCRTPTVTPPLVRQANKRKLKGVLVEQSGESPMFLKEIAPKGASVFNRLENDPSRQSGHSKPDNDQMEAESISRNSQNRRVSRRLTTGGNILNVQKEPRVSVLHRQGSPAVSSPSSSHSATMANMQRQLDDMKALLETGATAQKAIAGTNEPLTIKVETAHLQPKIHPSQLPLYEGRTDPEYTEFQHWKLAYIVSSLEYTVFQRWNILDFHGSCIILFREELIRC
ncbi:hypothetical protein OROGR_022840 [Orobanche gracilis]